MRSFPLIEGSVSGTERDFDLFVESHRGLYQADGSDRLPGDTLRMTVSAQVVAAEVAESRHTIEFRSLDAAVQWQTAGSIVHATTATESLQGRGRQVVSTLEITGPGIPHGRFAHADVERELRLMLAELAAARLLPLRGEPGRYESAA